MNIKHILFSILAVSALLSHTFPAYTAEEQSERALGSRKRPLETSGEEDKGNSPPLKKAKGLKNTSDLKNTSEDQEESSPMEVQGQGSDSHLFIIGGVGQGNLQAAIMGNFAFIYDAGTSSQTVLKKVAATRREEELGSFFLKEKKRVKKGPDLTNLIQPDFNNQMLSEESSILAPPPEESGSTDGSSKVWLVQKMKQYLK